MGKKVGKLLPKVARFRRGFRCLALEAKAQHSGSPVSLIRHGCFPTCIRPEGVSMNLRNCRRVRQTNRAVCDLELPGRGNRGLQGRLSTMRAPTSYRD
jgi:hypothetical protein